MLNETFSVILKQLILLVEQLSMLIIDFSYHSFAKKSLSWAFGFLAQTSEESEKHSGTHCSSHPKIGIGDLANKRVFGKGLLGLAWSQEPNVWWSMEMTHLQQQLKRENLRCCVDTIFSFLHFCVLFFYIRKALIFAASSFEKRVNGLSESCCEGRHNCRILGSKDDYRQRELIGGKDTRNQLNESSTPHKDP